jgi:hypothetical protein
MIRMNVLAGVVLLSACTSLVPTTVARLSTLSPVTADPAAMEIAVEFPAGLRPVDNSSKLIIGGKRTDTGQTTTLELTLMEQAGAMGVPVSNPDAAITVYRVAEGDIAALRQTQTQIAEWQDQAPSATEGSLSVGLGACRTGDGPAPDAKGSVYIRTKADGPMMPLIRNAGIAGLVGPEAFAAIGPCVAR